MKQVTIVTTIVISFLFSLFLLLLNIGASGVEGVAAIGAVASFFFQHRALVVTDTLPKLSVFRFQRLYLVLELPHASALTPARESSGLPVPQLAHLLESVLFATATRRSATAAATTRCSGDGSDTRTGCREFALPLSARPSGIVRVDGWKGSHVGCCL